MAENTGKPWTDDELEAAVFGYMFLLSLKRSGVSYPIAEFYKLVRSGPLSKRNDVSIRFRLRNITAVMTELGLPTLPSFSAASQVGNRVRERLSKIILSYANDPNFDPRSPPANVAPVSADRQQSLLDSVELLKAQIANLPTSSMVGHNNPPESIDDEDELLIALRDLSERLETLSDVEIGANLSSARIESEKNKLVSITFRLLNWGKNRVTKFIDAALVTAAPILIVSITDMTPKILDILSKIQNLMG